MHRDRIVALAEIFISPYFIEWLLPIFHSLLSTSYSPYKYLHVFIIVLLLEEYKHILMNGIQKSA